MYGPSFLLFSFFFNDTATTEIYTLSLHDALPIFDRDEDDLVLLADGNAFEQRGPDRKSTRLNSSHQLISYAVFCLKKKKITGNGCRTGGNSRTTDGRVYCQNTRR